MKWTCNIGHGPGPNFINKLSQLFVLSSCIWSNWYTANINLGI